MTDTLERDHQNAGMNLLRTPPGLTVYPDAQGFVPTERTLPYVRAYTSVAWPKEGAANAIDGRSVTCVVRWYVHCVGESENASLAIAGKVRERMIDKVPTVAGRNCGMIYYESDSGDPANRSELGGSPLYDLTVVYAMMSAPG